MGDTGNTVVVVDDEEAVRDYLNEVLTLEGYDCKCFPESSSALEYLGETPETPALVLTDIRMPGLDGLELLKRVRSLSPGLPVILISGYYEPSTALEAVRAGATDYLFKPAKPAEVISIVARHLRGDREPERAAVQVALARFLAQYKQRGSLDLLSEGQPDPAMELFRSLAWKRYETMQHSMRVAAYATLLGRAHGLASGPLWNLRLGALLHDVGKIAVPRNVLMKPASLSETEWRVMRTHPQIGFHLLAAFPGMKEAAEVVYAHHERYDGRATRAACAARRSPWAPGCSASSTQWTPSRAPAPTVRPRVLMWPSRNSENSAASSSIPPWSIFSSACPRPSWRLFANNCATRNRPAKELRN